MDYDDDDDDEYDDDDDDDDDDSDSNSDNNDDVYHGMTEIDGIVSSSDENAFSCNNPTTTTTAGAAVIHFRSDPLNPTFVPDDPNRLPKYHRSDPLKRRSSKQRRRSKKCRIRNPEFRAQITRLKREVGHLMTSTPQIPLSDLESRLEIIPPDDLHMLRFLGSGGFGEVYLCRWHSCEVAVKCLNPSVLLQAEAMRASDLRRSQDGMGRRHIGRGTGRNRSRWIERITEEDEEEGERRKTEKENETRRTEKEQETKRQNDGEERQRGRIGKTDNVSSASSSDENKANKKTMSELNERREDGSRFSSSSIHDDSRKEKSRKGNDNEDNVVDNDNGGRNIDTLNTTNDNSTNDEHNTSKRSYYHHHHDHHHHNHGSSKPSDKSSSNDSGKASSSPTRSKKGETHPTSSIHSPTRATDTNKVAGPNSHVAATTNKNQNDDNGNNYSTWRRRPPMRSRVKRSTAGLGGSVSFTAVSDLLREASLLAGLRHPNVVWVYGIVLPGNLDEIKSKAGQLIQACGASRCLFDSAPDSRDNNSQPTPYQLTSTLSETPPVDSDLAACPTQTSNPEPLPYKDQSLVSLPTVASSPTLTLHPPSSTSSAPAAAAAASDVTGQGKEAEGLGNREGVAEGVSKERSKLGGEGDEMEEQIREENGMEKRLLSNDSADKKLGAIKDLVVKDTEKKEKAMAERTKDLTAKNGSSTPGQSPSLVQSPLTTTTTTTTAMKTMESTAVVSKCEARMPLQLDAVAVATEQLQRNAASMAPGLMRAPALVTEFMGAGSLRAALTRRDEFLRSNAVRVKIALDAARGMEYLHSKRIVHFDLKSANLLVGFRDKSPVTKVADFGLSKQRRQTYVTGVTSLRGTIPWTAPEVIRTPKTVTERLDVYSFGVVLWELWTFREPHEGLHLHALLHIISTGGGAARPPMPGSPEWEGSIPEEPCAGWAVLVNRCLLENPEARPSFPEIVAELESMLAACKTKRRASSA